MLESCSHDGLLTDTSASDFELRDYLFFLVSVTLAVTN